MQVLNTSVGRDAGQKVPTCSIRRGSTETISTIDLLVGLSGVTALPETHPADRVEAALNDVHGRAE